MVLFSFWLQLNAEVIHLTEENFSTYVDGNSNVLVEFYAPWYAIQCALVDGTQVCDFSQVRTLQKLGARVEIGQWNLSTRRVIVYWIVNFFCVSEKVVSHYHSDIKIAAVDATVAAGLASQFGITGYPTIKYFGKGSTSPVDYDGGRTADTIVK